MVPFFILVLKKGKLQVNDLLAIIGNPGEDISSLLKGGGETKAEQPAKSSNGEAAPKQEQSRKPKPEPKPENQHLQKEKPAASGEKLDLGQNAGSDTDAPLSDTMTEGVIAGWHKKVGDTVKKGDCWLMWKPIKHNGTGKL